MLLHTSDWLGTNACFYNLLNQKHSDHIWEVIDFNRFDWDKEGLDLFLRVGYSAFGRTPIRGVRFLKPNSTLMKEGQELIAQVDQDAETSLMEGLHQESSAEDVLEQLLADISDFENATNGQLTLPLSGGLDSRFLLSGISDKTRLRAYSYGVSQQKDKSSEVVYAKAVSDRLGVTHSSIPLSGYHRYLNDWNQIFGPLVHAHGMYHIDFHTSIQALEKPNWWLSGLIGDAWAGSIWIDELRTPTDLLSLSLSYGIDLRAFLPHSFRNEILEEEFERIPTDKHKWRIVQSMRFKIVLLRYLIKIPEVFGYQVYAPFIKQHLALAMLSLPESDRKNRDWQRKYFESIGLDPENWMLQVDRSNNLDSQEVWKKNVPPLNENLLFEVVDRKIVRWVNDNLLRSPLSRLKYKLNRPFKGKRFVERWIPNDQHLKAYGAFRVLYPLQRLIEERDTFLSSNGHSL